MDGPTLVAILSFLVAAGSLWFAYVQTARVRARDRIDTIRHFLGIYREVYRDAGGDPARVAVNAIGPFGQEESWLFDYWSLLSLEFYFYERNQLPTDIFGVWMGDVAVAYCSEGHDRFWGAHQRFLKSYEPSLEPTRSFFEGLQLAVAQARVAGSGEPPRRIALDHCIQWKADRPGPLDLLKRQSGSRAPDWSSGE